MHTDEFACGGEIRYLEPVGALSVLPRVESAPADDGGVEPSLGEEEAACLVAEPGVLKVSQVALGVEGRRAWGFFGVRFFSGMRITQPFGQRPSSLPFYRDAELVSEPLAGFGEGFAQGADHEVDGAHRVVHADEASARVASLVEGEAGVVVVVEGAEAFVVAVGLEPQLLGDLLDGEVA